MISDTFHHCQIRPDDICNLSGRRIILHLCDVWNILDYLCFILYIFAFSLHVLAIPNLLVHIRRLYSVSLFVMFLRAFNLLLLFKRLGIIIIMVKEMVRLTPISIISMTILLTQTIFKKKQHGKLYLFETMLFKYWYDINLKKKWITEQWSQVPKNA